MKVLVTGSAGFIGKYVVEELEQAGHSVELCDIADGTGDVRDEAMVPRILATEAIVHLAAIHRVDEVAKDPDGAFVTNVLVTFDLARTARRRRLVFASSSAIYPDGWPTPKREDEVGPAPFSEYGRQKLAAERAVRIASSNHAILRLSNVIGEGQPEESGAVGAVFRAARARGERAPVYGGGQVRDFVPVRSVARAVRLALESRRRITANVSSGVGTSIANLAFQMGVEPEWLPSRDDGEYDVLAPDLFSEQIGPFHDPDDWRDAL